MDLTNVTKLIGNTIAKIKNNNMLIEELNKKFNPTFVEILENLQQTDPTLAKMLMVWYMDTYTTSEEELLNIVSKYQKKPKKTTSKSVCVSTGGCDAPYAVSGGCGSSSSRLYNSSVGCGISSVRSGC